MANYSDTYVIIEGDKEKISAAMAALAEVGNVVDGGSISPHMPADKKNTISGGYNSMTFSSVDIGETKVVLSGEGHWAAPDEFFMDLCRTHSLNMHYEDSEAGGNFYRLVEIENGEVKREIDTEFGSAEHMKSVDNKEFFLEWYANITETEGWEEEHVDVISAFASAGVSIEELRKEWRVEAPVEVASDFLNDEEKMRDFYSLSSEEFLACYSYVDKTEYDMTLNRVLQIKDFAKTEQEFQERFKVINLDDDVSMLFGHSATNQEWEYLGSSPRDKISDFAYALSIRHDTYNSVSDAYDWFAHQEFTCGEPVGREIIFQGLFAKSIENASSFAVPMSFESLSHANILELEGAIGDHISTHARFSPFSGVDPSFYTESSFQETAEFARTAIGNDATPPELAIKQYVGMKTVDLHSFINAENPYYNLMKLKSYSFAEKHGCFALGHTYRDRDIPLVLSSDYWRDIKDFGADRLAAFLQYSSFFEHESAVDKIGYLLKVNTSKDEEFAFAYTHRAIQNSETSYTEGSSLFDMTNAGVMDRALAPLFKDGTFSLSGVERAINSFPAREQASDEERVLTDRALLGMKYLTEVDNTRAVSFSDFVKQDNPRATNNKKSTKEVSPRP